VKVAGSARKNVQESQTWAAAFSALLSLPVLMFFLAQFLASLTRGTQSSGAIHLFPAYAYGSRPEVIGTIASGAAIVGIPIVFSTGTIMDKFGRKWTVVPGFFLLSLALGGMAWVAWANLPIEGYVVSFICMQAALNVTSGNMQVIGSDIAPAHVRGKFFGVWRMIGELGTAISPLGFASIAEAFGYEYSFGLLAGSSFACADVLLVFGPDPVKKYKAQQAAAQAAAAGTAGPVAAPTAAATPSVATQSSPGSP
jgi:MFS family permease